MGRNKSFDEAQVLTAAMHAFRERGYEATSIKHLEQATGLLPGSLYHAYGSKKALFEAALAHYTEKVVRGRIATYLESAPGVDGIEAFFQSTRHEPDGRTLGCLLTNSAVEFGPAAGTVADHVRSGFALIEQAFATHVARAQAAGLMSADAPPKRIAAKLLLLYQGVLVLVRFGRDKRELATLITDLLTPLRTGESHV